MLFSVTNVHSSTVLPTFPFFVEQNTLPHFLKNKQNSNPQPFCNMGEIQLWLIKTICFTYLSQEIDPAITKHWISTFRKFYSLNFQKLLMIKQKKIFPGKQCRTQSFLGHTVTRSRTRTLTKVLESVSSDRQLDKRYRSILILNNSFSMNRIYTIKMKNI